jgi:hypothetical protein
MVPQTLEQDSTAKRRDPDAFTLKVGLALPPERDTEENSKSTAKETGKKELCAAGSYFRSRSLTKNRTGYAQGKRLR